MALPRTSLLLRFQRRVLFGSLPQGYKYFAATRLY
jgi:hypothetical protein